MMKPGRLKYVIGVGIAAVAATWIVASILAFIAPEESPPHLFPIPPIASSPFSNTTAAATYVGTEACINCHSEQDSTYRQTAHSQALADVDPATEPTGVVFFHQPSGREYQVFGREGKIHHRETLRAADGTALANVEFPVSLLIGSGRHTRSYLVEDRDFWIQSPITWYASTKAWGMSPGYDTAQHWGFGRMVGTDCLTCHTGTLSASQQQFRGIAITEQAIGCERCHGPGSLHVERHRQESSSNGKDLTIVQPASLSRPLLEATCGQCHLQSAATVRLRGRDFADFRPGLPLTDFRIDYQQAGGNQEMTVTGHLEQMRLSRCYQQSQTLTCTTCHTLHAPPEDKAHHYRQKCVACHGKESCKLEPTRRHQQSRQDDCVNCHMPTSGTDIPHVAFTHHRIGVHGRPNAGTEASNSTLVPVENIAHLPDIDQDRSLGLAYLQFSEKGGQVETAQAARHRAMELLTSVYDRGLQDGETLAALAKLFVDQDDKVAEELAERAIESPNLEVASRCEALFTLADIAFRSARREIAVQHLQELVELRRMYEDWFLLGSCHYLSLRPQQAIEALEQARLIDPFRPEVHQLLQRSYSQVGDQAKASSHQVIGQALRAASSP